MDKLSSFFAFLVAFALMVPGVALAQVTAPTLDTTMLDGIGTAVLAALAVIASVGIVIKLLRRA